MILTFTKHLLSPSPHAKMLPEHDLAESSLAPGRSQSHPYFTEENTEA